MVVIDLMDNKGWKNFRLPYLYPIHYSPVTSVHLTSSISEKVFELLKNAHLEQNRLSNTSYSIRPWPIKCGQNRVNQTEFKNVSLLITG